MNEWTDLAVKKRADGGHLVQFKANGWDVAWVGGGDERFTCPVCRGRGRCLHSIVVEDVRVTMCPRCWKEYR